MTNLHAGTQWPKKLELGVLFLCGELHERAFNFALSGLCLWETKDHS